MTSSFGVEASGVVAIKDGFDATTGVSADAILGTDALSSKIAAKLREINFFKGFNFSNLPCFSYFSNSQYFSCFNILQVYHILNVFHILYVFHISHPTLSTLFSNQTTSAMPARPKSPSQTIARFRGPRGCPTPTPWGCRKLALRRIRRGRGCQPRQR